MSMCVQVKSGLPLLQTVTLLRAHSSSAGTGTGGPAAPFTPPLSYLVWLPLEIIPPLTAVLAKTETQCFTAAHLHDNMENL